MSFIGTASQEIASMSVSDNSTETAITTSGKGNKVQYTLFDTVDYHNGLAADHTNDHVTTNIAGHYEVSISISIDSVAGAAAKFGLSAYINNGATELANIHKHQNFAGGGGQAMGVTLGPGVVDLAASDTIELWVWNETNTQNVLLSDVTMVVEQVAGT